MPTGQNNKGSKPTQSKTDFVRKLDPRLPAKEVVERAKKAGIELDESYVYVIRSNARRKKRDRAKGRAPAAAAVKPRGSAREREFRRLAWELGVEKAEALLGDTKKRIHDLMAGK